jgi:formamidopyrimidine-DNA glycosylase
MHLGPDALARGTLTRLVGKRNVKSVLLDQTVVAGVGNIYADEALFASRIHPLRTVDSVGPDELKVLRRELGKVLRSAIRARGTTFDDFAYVDAYGRRGAFTPKVYGRDGQPCIRCGGPITKLVVAQRGTHVCDVCQPNR